MGQGCVIWLTGLPSSGKTTLAIALAQKLAKQNVLVEVLDGDEIRLSLSAGLGFSADDRKTHAQRVIYVAKLLARNGVHVVVPLISPYQETRDLARSEIPEFIEVYVKCPLDECIRRDVKGLYAKALSGEISEFTGVSDPYEEPTNPEIVLETAKQSEEECIRSILLTLNEKGILDVESENLSPKP